jgi:hypothetical protein
VRLPDVVVVLIDLLRADRLPDIESDGDEGEPAENCRLPMVGAPATHPRREVV